MSPQLRLIVYQSPRADKVAARGLIEGMVAFFGMRGIKLYVDERGYPSYWENFERGKVGKIDADIYRTRLLQEAEMFTNTNGFANWVLCITNEDINAPSAGLNNFVFGGITFEPQDFPREIKAAAIICSTINLRDSDTNLKKCMGALIGYHEAAHIQYESHCPRRDCVFYSGVDNGVPGLRELALLMWHQKKIPSCGRH